MRLWLGIILCGLTLLSYAQEAWPGSWEGDTDEYVYEDGILSHKDNGLSGTATIKRLYQPKEPTKVTWTFKTIFKSPPTSQNSFSMTLFCEVLDHERFCYVVAPSADASSLSLLQTYEKQESGGQWTKISEKTLDSHTLSFAMLAWDNLQIQVDYDRAQGVRIHTFTPHGELKSGQWKETKRGKETWEMVLVKRFTSQRKLLHTMTLPRFRASEEEAPQELLITNNEVEEIGRVTLTLNQPVDASAASVFCQGFYPTLMHGTEPNVLVINLGATFQCNRSYDFTVSNLRTMQGDLEELLFTVNIGDDTTPNTEIPTGVFITEIMADPPEIGPLRGIKYIELFNNTGTKVQLGNLRLLYGKTKYPLPPVALMDNTFAVIYLESNPYPTTLATLVPLSTFPALSGSFTLTLQDLDGEELDQVRFTTRLYGEGATKGGASVERVAYQPDQWRRSNHPDGGTPGKHTTLAPYNPVEHQSVVINELMLSPGSTGEKYLELYNPSSQAVQLSDLYLTFSNKEETLTTTSWLLVPDDLLLQPNSYTILTPFPEALERLYPLHDASTFIERIDFPSISPTYSEVLLRAHHKDQIIDEVIYRKQWLGAESSDRTGYSLERIHPTADGKARSSWQRARENGAQKATGGTPGVRNSVFGISNSELDQSPLGQWPDQSELSLEQIEPLLHNYGQVASLELYSLTGDMLLSAQGSSIPAILQQLREGTSLLPTSLVAIRLTFKDENKEPAELTYRDVWLHLALP